MCLICLKFIDLIFINRLRMSMTFYRKYTLCYCNVLSCFFSMAPTHIDPTGFYVNPIYFYGMRIFIRKTRPDFILPFQFFCRKNFFWTYKAKVFSWRINKCLKFYTETACNLSKYAKRGISCTFFNLSEHTFTDSSLLRNLAKAHSL